MEVAAAAATTEGNKWPAALPRSAAITMCVLSLLFVGLAARTLRRSGAGGEDEEFSAVVRMLSPLVCAYLFSWTVALSATRSGTVVPELMRASFLPLLSAAAAELVGVGPRAVAAAMFLGTVYSATASGRALADRRQRAGTDRSAAAASALSAPTYRSRAEERQERLCRGVLVSCLILMAAMSAAVLLLIAWLAPPEQQEGDQAPQAPAPGEAELGALVLAAGPYLVATRLLLQHGSPLEGDAGTCVKAVAIGAVVAVSVGVLFGVVAAMVVVWAGALCMAGFFGYGLAVEARYNQLLIIKRSQPRTAEDASGLLVGRDGEDACAAHIDAAAGVDIDRVFPRCSRCRR